MSYLNRKDNYWVNHFASPTEDYKHYGVPIPWWWSKGWGSSLNGTANVSPFLFPDCPFTPVLAPTRSLPPCSAFTSFILADCGRDGIFWGQGYVCAEKLTSTLLSRALLCLWVKPRSHCWGKTSIEDCMNLLGHILCKPVVSTSSLWTLSFSDWYCSKHSKCFGGGREKGGVTGRPVDKMQLYKPCFTEKSCEKQCKICFNCSCLILVAQFC